MNCPKCSSQLLKEKYKSIDIDKCAICHGIWLDFNELDQLEDTVLQDDNLKGTMITRPHESTIQCPKCQGDMQQFRYRYNELFLDACTANHGFWLDKGEEKQIVELMERRVKKLKRSSKAEQEWSRFLSNRGANSIFDKLKNAFRR